MIPVVVIYGPKGSGKDTFGKRLAQAMAMCLPKTQKRVEVLGFADPARDLVERAIGIPGAVLRGDSKSKELYKAYGVSARQHLRDTTRFLRDKHPDLLAHAALRRIMSASSEVGGFVFTDARMGNEYSVLDEVLVRGCAVPWTHGITPIVAAPVCYKLALIGITRPGSEDPSDRHETETSFGEFVQFGGLHVVNDGPLDKLLARADALGAEFTC